MSVDIEATGGDEVRAVLRAAARGVAPEARKVLNRAALNVKTDAQRRASGIRYAPAYPRSITYDVDWRGDAGRAEVGPDKDRRQGALGNVLEYGIASQNTLPHPHLGPALDAEVPNFEKYLGDLGEELLE
jgi:hypothetical protein